MGNTISKHKLSANFDPEVVCKKRASRLLPPEDAFSPTGEEKKALEADPPKEISDVSGSTIGIGRLKSPAPVKEYTDFGIISKILTVVSQCDNTTGSELGKLILGALQVWLDLYQLAGFPYCQDKIDYYAKSVTTTYNEAYSVGCLSGTFVTYFKYKIAAFFSAWNNQVIPKAPAGINLTDPKVLFGGAFYRFTKRMAAGSRKTFYSSMGDIENIDTFSLSILMSKKGMPRPTKADIEKAERKSEETMTTPKAEETWIPSPDMNVNATHYMPIFDKHFIIQEAKRTAREIFGGHNLTLNQLSEMVLPSSSANYINGRADYGSYGSLEDSTPFQEFKESFMTDPLPRLQYKATKLRKLITEYYGEKGEWDQAVLDIDDGCKEVIGAELDDSELRQNYRKFWWKCFAYARDIEIPAVKVVGLAEALKVRVISKGPPVASFVLKTFQQWMWKRLQAFPLFRLTGEPVTEEFMNKYYGRLVPGAQRLHSGDYSAATDELHSYVSEAIATEICACLDESFPSLGQLMHPLLLKLLTRHVYEMIDGRYELQERGQLMGSIISFPILCIANAALIRASYEVSHNVLVSLRKLKALINGDDCHTLYTSPEFPEVWRNLGRVMGLSESIGKTYDDERMSSINSMFFDLSDEGWFVMRPYINVGLINNQQRSSVAGEGKVNLMDLAARHWKLMEQSKDHSGANRLFIYRNMELLKSFKGSWYLPQWCGGLGLKTFEPHSDMDLKLARSASILIEHGEGPKFLREKGDWLHYDYFKRELRESMPLLVTYPAKQFDNDDRYGTAFKSICWMRFLGFGVDGLRGQDNGSSDQEKMNRYNLEVLHRFSSLSRRLLASYKYELKPMEAEYIDKEERKAVLPVWSVLDVVDSGTCVSDKVGFAKLGWRSGTPEEKLSTEIFKGPVLPLRIPRG